MSPTLARGAIDAIARGSPLNPPGLVDDFWIS